MVDSMSTRSSLEITRNPFDNGREERTNCPGFSPSMFCHQETPESQKKRRTFRWSIEQISRLNPADIDEFPIQEYSSTFEREEDEIAAQKAVDEYFSQSFIVPSPWTPNHEAKHVKFSPLPPATAYIEAESSVESSYSSPSSSKCKHKADASSQTKLSLPPDFDLQNHLGSTYYNQDGLNGSKDISLSSLRRKLFMQVENQNATEKDLLEIKSILKSPKSPVLVTSSPVSDQSTPRHAIKNRHSTASTMSSPNISPIKPLLSVPETPTSTRRPYLSRQSLSPMECSTNVFESSGIEIIGDALPDLSPIKANSRPTDSNLATEAEHVENPNTSLDDGGPLEVLALSVKDDNEGEEKWKEVEDIDNDDDDEMPPKITMEDLAEDLDSTEENGSAHSKDSPQIKFKEPTPKLEPVPDENAAAEAMDTGNVRSESTTAEHPEFPKESSMQIEDVGSNFTQEPRSYDHSNEHLGLKKDYPFSRYPTASTYGNWHTKNYSTVEHFHKSSHLNELDDDVIMMRAKAALRRANRFSPTQGVSSYSYDPHSLTLSDLSLNTSTTWEPVRMSTPLAPHLSNPGNYRSHRDRDSPYGYKSISRAHRHSDSAGVTYSEESGLGRSGGNMASHYSHGVSGKRLSPAVEDMIQRRNFQGGYEGRYPLSSSWKKASSPLFSSKYDGKWKLSHTHPMSYVEWKALYWRPPRDHFTWRDRRYQTNQYGYESDFKRSSWPPRPMSSKLMYGSRPLSPPVTLPPTKVPRAVPGGFVSKIALPSYQDNSDSGYSDWQRGVSHWENTVRSQNSLSGYAGEFRYY